MKIQADRNQQKNPKNRSTKNRKKKQLNQSSQLKKSIRRMKKQKQMHSKICTLIKAKKTPIASPEPTAIWSKGPRCRIPSNPKIAFQ